MTMLRRLGIATALALTATAAPSIPVGAATTPVSGTFVFDDTHSTCPDPPAAYERLHRSSSPATSKAAGTPTSTGPGISGHPAGSTSRSAESCSSGSSAVATTGPSRRPTRSNPNGTPTSQPADGGLGTVPAPDRPRQRHRRVAECHRFPRPHRHRPDGSMASIAASSASRDHNVAGRPTVGAT